MANATNTNQIQELLTVATERRDQEMIRICLKAIKGSQKATKEALDTIEHRIAAFGEL